MKKKYQKWVNNTVQCLKNTHPCWTVCGIMVWYAKQYLCLALSFISGSFYHSICANASTSFIFSEHERLLRIALRGGIAL